MEIQQQGISNKHSIPCTMLLFEINWMASKNKYFLFPDFIHGHIHHACISMDRQPGKWQIDDSLRCVR